jgi:hypothetical protein
MMKRCVWIFSTTTRTRAVLEVPVSLGHSRALTARDAGVIVGNGRNFWLTIFWVAPSHNNRSQPDVQHKLGVHISFPLSTEYVTFPPAPPPFSDTAYRIFLLPTHQQHQPSSSNHSSTSENRRHHATQLKRGKSLLSLLSFSLSLETACLHLHHGNNNNIVSYYKKTNFHAAPPRVVGDGNNHNPSDTIIIIL